MKISARSFTLVELLITTSIFVVVAATSYSAFHTGMFGYRDIDRSIKLSIAAGQMLGRMDEDIRNSFKYAPDKCGFEGTDSSIRFLTLARTYYGELEPRRELALVSYSVSQGHMSRLFRKGVDSMNEKSGTKPEEMAGDIRVDRFELEYGYIDKQTKELTYKRAWDPDIQKSLPKFVKIGLGLSDKDRRINRDFIRTIFLPMAE